MSYQAHRSHRGTHQKKVGRKEMTAVVCGFCDLTNFDPRIRKPCNPQASSTPPVTGLPEVIQ